ncbi:flagellin [Thorsellia anophelis]|uniref:Flagellin C-terminal helical region n=1 Tax=Thorsellia anophelis DSM 18579 TaxID=1123402 RepID=A0A1I0APM6_9GAMM|nr:flagellin [Thorsellia anophelis]SES96223.1 flagellin C-terminal helical region [Thorsellia anophelis DSM 18579]
MLKVAPNVGVRKIDDKYVLNFIASDKANELGFYEGQNVYWHITDRLDEITFFTTSPSPSTLYIRVTPLYLTGSFDELFIDVGDAIFSVGGESVSAKTAMPLKEFDSAMKKIDEYRGELGAVMNRLESTMQNISTSKINLEAARSRIEDADYAVEVSNMSRVQILQQAGMSVLSQANQSPELVLQLLK